MKKVKEETLYDAAELFKVFGDSTRIRILYSLIDNKEKNVNEIAKELGMNQSAISHQLRILKNSKLIKNKRKGKMVCYSLNDEHVYNIIAQGIEHTEEK
ncbi:MAG: metalloregulator ArsR/SmtB family transcription factor [Erysipelotrichaceae bacterium]|nr:metalloregulator ArsR/SmtB family transcription factor [Erysipelotrichaceae bacterium]